MDKTQKALGYFNKGFNCSQAIFTAFNEDNGTSEETALKLSCGFGAGCGRLGLTCGAVSGAFMVIGMKYGKFREDDNAAKEKTYAKVREFTQRFIDRNKSINCTELLGCNLGTSEGMEKAHKEGLIAKICPRLVQEAAEILSSVIV
jgi:C_GCAxxG_C_C family probable redox protein